MNPPLVVSQAVARVAGSVRRQLSKVPPQHTALAVEMIRSGVNEVLNNVATPKPPAP
jgi:hypothetical protein